LRFLLGGLCDSFWEGFAILALAVVEPHRSGKSSGKIEREDRFEIEATRIQGSEGIRFLSAPRETGGLLVVTTKPPFVA